MEVEPVGFYAKLFWLIGACLLAGLGFWLGLVIPSQGWAQWDGTRWQVVAESWAVLWRGWPLAVLGALAGFSAAWIGLAFALKHAKEADFRAKIVRLTRQRDTAVMDAEARVREREQAAQRRESEASAKQQEAENMLREARAARERVEQERAQAEQVIKATKYRATNAICAAERIKRRAEKQRRATQTSAP